jgi:hypothetical protein
MMLLADSERREQEFTIGESRSRLVVWVKRFYTQMRARSNRGLCLSNGSAMPENVWFRHGHF